MKKTIRDDYMNNPPAKLWPRLVFIALAMLVAMTVYEALKQLLFPDIEIWESHLITIFFSTAVATSAGYFIIKKQIKLNRELTQKNIESEKLQQELEDKLAQLNEVLSQVKTLSGMLPICASCKKIRNDEGYWTRIETYIKAHSDADFSHGICPECASKLYPDYTSTRNNDK